MPQACNVIKKETHCTHINRTVRARKALYANKKHCTQINSTPGT